MSSDDLFESDEDSEATNKLNGTADDINFDIIAGTPQKTTKKKTSNRITNPEAVSTSNFKKHQHLSEFCVLRNNTFFNSENNTSIKYENNTESNLNIKYKKPYVFYEILDVLSFTEFKQPTNSKLKIVGLHKQLNVGIHCLMEYKRCLNIIPPRIVLNMKLLEEFPTNNTAIEIYGFITFPNSNLCSPIFVIEFWRSIEGSYHKYLKCLRQQKFFVPSCFKEITDGNLNYSECVNYTFEEVNESYLSKKVDYIEQICCEFDQIMNISDDIFM